MVSQETRHVNEKTGKNWARRQNPQRGSVDQWGAQNEGMYAVVLVFNCATIRQCRSRGFDPVSRS